MEFEELIHSFSFVPFFCLFVNGFRWIGGVECLLSFVERASEF